MLRYCPYCEKDYDFSPLSVSGKDDLICPECGNIIDKNSRHPANTDEGTKHTEEGIGRIFAGLYNLFFIFYMLMAIIGVIAFVSGMKTLLFTVTVISLAVFIIQLITGTLIFTSGIFFLPVGAVIGYLIFKSIPGACLGIHIVFLIRHILRDIIFRLLGKLINAGS